MLVLSRKADEAIVIGGQVRVVVVAIRGDKVRVGVEAPKEVTVDREEIYSRKVRAGQPPPAFQVCTKQEYDLLEGDQEDFEEEMFCGRRLFVRMR